MNLKFLNFEKYRQNRISKIERIKWIKKLRRKIIEKEDHILFNEATGCFLTGQYRAAYIVSWIAIIESLKRKIEAFSNFGDNRAKEALEKIEKAENNKQSTDRLIFDGAKNCNLLDTINYSVILFLWEQRSIFAHPYNKSPEEDEIKYILNQAVTIVLSSELMYNKNLLKELSRNIAETPHFLPNDNDLIIEHAINSIARTPVNLHPFFFKTLLGHLGEIVSLPKKASEIKKLRLYIIELFKRTSLPLDDNRFTIEDRVTRYPYECFLGFIDNNIWLKLTDRVKGMLIDYLSSEKDKTRLNYLLYICSKLYKEGLLNNSHEKKYLSKLSGLDFKYVINFYNEKSKFERIIFEINTGRYELQNPVIEFLNSDEGDIFYKSLIPDQQFKLGRYLNYSAFQGNWKALEYILNVIKEKAKLLEGIKSGIAYSYFIDKNDNLNLKMDRLNNAIILLNQVNKANQDKCYEMIYDKIAKNEPDDLEHLVYTNDKFSEIQSSIIEKITTWKGSNKEYFMKLITMLKEHYKPE